MKFIPGIIFDFFLPRFCPGCNKKLLPDDNPVCTECLSSILIADEIRLEDEYDRNFSSSKIIKDFYSRFVFETDKTLQDSYSRIKISEKVQAGNVFR